MQYIHATINDVATSSSFLDDLLLGVAIALFATAITFLIRLPLEYFKVPDRIRNYVNSFLVKLVTWWSIIIQRRDWMKDVLPMFMEELKSAPTFFAMLKVVANAITAKKPQGDIPDISEIAGMKGKDDETEESE